MTERVVTIKRQPRTLVRIVEVSLTSIDEVSIDIADFDSEPSSIIGRKAEAVADLLGCSYEQAERLVIGFSE